MRKLLVSFLVVFSLIGTAKAETVNECIYATTVKSIGISAAYGAGVMFVGSGLGVWLAPAGMYTTGQAFTIVALNTFTGGALGAGSSAVTHLVLNNEFDGAALRPACLKKAVVEGFLRGFGRLMD